MLKREQRHPSYDLLRARRMVEELEEVEILEDLKWDPLICRWVLLCRLSADVKDNEVVLGSTNWYVHIEDGYPWGEINFFPAKAEGLKGTFPHQNYNGESEPENLWTNGKICLDTGYKKLRQLGLDDEPYDFESRLVWHFERALSWLKEAARGTLKNPGDPYELPDFNHNLHTVVFNENNDSFLKWKKIKNSYGLMEFLFYKKDDGKPFVITPTRFLYINGKEIYKPDWGNGILNIKSKSQILTGGWIILNEVPIISPWKAPMNWGELKEACASQGIDIMDNIKSLSIKLRDGKSHYILIGFPVPDQVNGDFKQIHWQPILLPMLSNITGKVRGFRNSEKFNWLRDLNKAFRNNENIYWLNSENWHDGELFNRGRLERRVRVSSILQLGAGAVGSMLSELLIRSGQKEITIMDDDILKAGNIVRNTLTLEDILQFKVDKLKERLHNISPHSKVQGIREKFLSPMTEKPINYEKFDVILDCTGEDSTIYNLSRISFKKSKTFLSISLGYEAKRLFVFYSNGHKFNHDAFIQLIQPWLVKEKSGTEHIKFPREGIGCWHPVFPARADDVWLMVSTAFKSIERAILGKCNKSTLLVYEQEWEKDLFKGITLVSHEVYNE